MTEEAAKPSVWQEISVLLRQTARVLAQRDDRTRELKTSKISEDRAVVLALHNALFDAYREEWYNRTKKEGLETELAIAKKMMLDDGFQGLDPICGQPNAKAPVANVDGVELVCYEFALGGALPLSSYFLDRVFEAIEIVGKVNDLKRAGGAVHAEPELPSERGGPSEGPAPGSDTQ